VDPLLPVAHSNCPLSITQPSALLYTLSFLQLSLPKDKRVLSGNFQCLNLDVCPLTTAVSVTTVFSYSPSCLYFKLQGIKILPAFNISPMWPLVCVISYSTEKSPAFILCPVDGGIISLRSIVLVFYLQDPVFLCPLRWRWTRRGQWGSASSFGPHVGLYPW
jgi:hypothetical protein